MSQTVPVPWTECRWEALWQKACCPILHAPSEDRPCVINPCLRIPGMVFTSSADVIKDF